MFDMIANNIPWVNILIRWIIVSFILIDILKRESD